MPLPGRAVVGAGGAAPVNQTRWTRLTEHAAKRDKTGPPLAGSGRVLVENQIISARKSGH